MIANSPTFANIYFTATPLPSEYVIGALNTRLLSRLDPSVVTDAALRRKLHWEVAVVLAVTFALSGLYSILGLVRALLSKQALAEQTTTLNQSQSVLGWLDALYQLAHSVQLLAWAGLPLVMLAHTGIAARGIGLVREKLGKQLGWGLALSALIGIPGLMFYLGTVAAGLNLQVAASGLGETWWRPLMLMISAATNGVAEEILVVGYLLYRLRQLGWSPLAAVMASALLRASYHLYQGFGGGLGNFAMGVVFALFWLRQRRVLPLIVAHTAINVVAFIGYALLAPRVGWL